MTAKELFTAVCASCQKTFTARSNSHGRRRKTCGYECRKRLSATTASRARWSWKAKHAEKEP